MSLPLAASAALPLQRRTLLFAVAFHDVFLPADASSLIRIPLQVEALGGPAWPGSDGSYRFSVTGDPPLLPVGTFPIDVVVPGGEYRAFDPIEVTLPVATSVPPTREQFLALHALWPTRRFRVPPGETAVVGVVAQLGVPQPGLSVRLHAGAVPPPGTPEARTDEAGEFVYRFPFASAASGGATLSSTVTVLDGGSPVVVTPASLTLAAGRVHVILFERP